MSELVIRQLEMLNLIPKGRPGIRTADIEILLRDNGFKISRRTIQRDLEVLSSFFPLTNDQDGREYLWFYNRDSKPVLIPSMDLNTALTLKLAQNHLQPLIPPQVRTFLAPYFPEANKVLKNHPSRLKCWTDKTRAISLGLQQIAPQVDDSVWDVLSRCILNQELCKVSYRSQNAARAKTYHISPLAIVIRGPVTYLLAVYQGYQDIRQMAMHRFCQAESVVGEYFSPKDFDLDAYINAGNFGILYDEVPQKLTMTVSSSIVRILQEAPLSEDQEIKQSDAAIEVSCTLPESWDLYRWLLSHSMDVKVNAPAHIRETHIGHLTEALNQY